jgi:hypothetical protein
MKPYKPFTINGILIVASNYNEHKSQYEFYDIHARLTATITSQRIRVSKDKSKAWERLANTFGD